MREQILEKLNAVEKEQRVRILYACESGSRAWGFASPDSDYDVRFVYVHERDWYLGIEDRKDFIELPLNEVFDVVGYDIRKMLKLYRGSNAKIFEWLQSPEIYVDNGFFRNTVWALRKQYYSHRAGMHHYLGLTKNTLDNDLQGAEVKLKKYFYALRPVLAACWIMENGTNPPTEFRFLKPLVTDAATATRIEELEAQKVQAGEQFMIAADPELNRFIRERFEACSQYAQTLEPLHTDAEPLNRIFKETIGIK